MRPQLFYQSCKRNASCEIQTHFVSALPANLTEKLLAAIARFLRPKTKLFAVNFICIFEDLCLLVLRKTFWAQFHDFLIQQRSCWPWSSDAFSKFSASEFCRISSGGNSTISASENEVVSHGVQTHFGCSLPVSFTE